MPFKKNYLDSLVESIAKNTIIKNFSNLNNFLDNKINFKIIIKINLTF